MKVKFSRCTNAKLASVPKEDGQIIYVTDTAECYIDFLNTRIRVEDKELINKANALDTLTQQHTQEITQIKRDISNIEAMHSFSEYNGLVIDKTTPEFFESIRKLNLNPGTILLGQTELKDLDEIAPNMHNEEMKVEIYPDEVFHARMTSTNVAPYEWSIQFWQGEGTWIPIKLTASDTKYDNVGTNLTATNVQDAITEIYGLLMSNK